MKIIRQLVLYMALALGANAAFADAAALNDLRSGDMKKLNFHEQPKAVSGATFDREDGSKGTLADFHGKYTLLNFWATWCAPCRAEMPMLSDLQAQMGGKDFQVITIATGRNPPAAMKKFFKEIGVSNLPLHRDPQSALAREMGVFGLPITVVLDKNGMEIGRLLGDAEWNSGSAQAIIQALIDGAGAT